MEEREKALTALAVADELQDKIEGQSSGAALKEAHVHAMLYVGDMLGEINDTLRNHVIATGRP